jgi:hypothetical protein
MSQSFIAGDDLIFQLESGYGLVRVVAVEGEAAATIWHLVIYEELFPDVESAEKALANPESLHLAKRHLALTDRAFERTPAAKLGHRAITDEESAAYFEWRESPERQVFDRSLLLLLGMR